MEFIVIPVVALLASGLTLFSGFGLGTLLLPAFLLFFPPQLAVAMTAIVHVLNNLFKLGLMGRHANFRVVVRFGLPAIVAAYAGAALLFLVSARQPLFTYTLLGASSEVTAIKIVMGFLIAGFAAMEAMPFMRRFEFDPRYLPLGGLLSGFFGGLSGHQGALRSAFLIRAGLSKEAFVATGIVIACLVDLTRLGVYARHLAVAGLEKNAVLLIAVTLSAFLGAFVGNRLVKKVTMKAVQSTVAAMLFLISLLLIAGLI
ncbi:MAG TPA: TSUP family transporter [Bacteroidota bacterium]|nr:TSUP family transporter [Bacteroidota bacterium]